MKNIELISGTLFQFGDTPEKCRVILMDNVQIMYEPWSDLAQEWYFIKLNQKIVYFRVTKLFAERTLKILGNEPYPMEVLNIHRPDLPLRLCNTNKLEWKGDWGSYESFQKRVKSGELAIQDEVELNAPEIVLVPKGKRFTMKPGVKVVADNGKFFTPAELLYKAWKLQHPHTMEPGAGVGIIRSGLQKMLPSFSMGYYFDTVAKMKDYQAGNFK
jgi:hypothetical protein